MAKLGAAAGKEGRSWKRKPVADLALDLDLNLEVEPLLCSLAERRLEGSSSSKAYRATFKVQAPSSAFFDFFTRKEFIFAPTWKTKVINRWKNDNGMFHCTCLGAGDSRVVVRISRLLLNTGERKTVHRIVHRSVSLPWPLQDRYAVVLTGTILDGGSFTYYETDIDNVNDSLFAMPELKE